MSRVGSPQRLKGGELPRVTTKNPGNKEDRTRLRSVMLQSGRSYTEIAEQMLLRWHFRPRQAWRHAHGFTQDEVAQRYNEVVDDAAAAMTGKRISDYESWPNSGARPLPGVLAVLATIYQTTPANLVDYADLEHMPRADVQAIQSAHPPLIDGTYIESNRIAAPKASAEDRLVLGVANRELPQRPPTLKDVLEYISKQSRDHAERAEMTNLPLPTLEELDNEVRRLTKEHLYINSLELFSDTVRARDRVYRLLEGHQYPAQTSHLYLLASILCALLADTCASVGYHSAASEHIHAAGVYAEIIGHNSLRVWSRAGLEASLALWGGREHRALQLSESAANWPSTAISRLHVYNARGLHAASLGKEELARDYLQTARDLREHVQDDDELYDEFRGMFAYPAEKQSQIAAVAYVKLGDAQAAMAEATKALDLYRSKPAEERAFGNEASASIDLARGHLISGEIEGAAEALTDVLRLPPIQRQEWFVLRLKEFRRDLDRKPFLRLREAEDLSEEIEVYCSDTVSRQLPTPEVGQY
jgi:tetratricopeptide (TPR) repeat protein